MLYSTLWGTKYYVTPAWHKGSYAVPPDMRRRASHGRAAIETLPGVTRLPRLIALHSTISTGAATNDIVDLTFRVSTVKSKR